MGVEQRQQPVIEGFEGGSLQFSSGLAHGTFSDDPFGLSGKRFKQLIQERLETAFPGTEQKSHEDGKREHALARKGLRLRAMAGDKVRVVQYRGKTGQDVGLYIARVNVMIFFVGINKLNNKL